MPFIKIWVHFVWATRKRNPILTEPFRTKLFEHMKENARSKNLYVDRVNGFVDHVHCLLSLGSGQTIEKTIQLLKGEAAFWFNKNFTEKLEWQNDYFAVSVSESGLPSLRDYIDRQNIHHQRKSFDQECKEIILQHNLKALG